jgi:transposase
MNFVQQKLEALELKSDALLEQIPGVEQMLGIKGIGKDTVIGFFSEVGDLNNYSHPRQIIKLAGLNLKENTSGKHKGKSTITKRGRKKLRALLFRVIMPLVAKNSAFNVTDIGYWPEVDGFNCPSFDGSFVKKGEATVNASPFSLL